MLEMERANTAALLSEMESRGQLSTTKVSDPLTERTYRLYEVTT